MYIVSGIVRWLIFLAMDKTNKINKLTMQLLQGIPLLN